MNWAFGPHRLRRPEIQLIDNRHIHGSSLEATCSRAGLCWQDPIFHLQSATCHESLGLGYMSVTPRSFSGLGAAAAAPYLSVTFAAFATLL